MKPSRVFAHGFLLFFVGLFFVPLYIALVCASHTTESLLTTNFPVLPSLHLFSNIKEVLCYGFSATGGDPVWKMLLNSLIMALIIALGKIFLAITSAFALVYFNLPGKRASFALIFITMMLPIEVRIVPTFHLVANLKMLDSYMGLTVPLLASATATFLFRQFFKTIPQSLTEAAKLDGAGPLQFFWHIVLPLSKNQMIALFIVMFIYGWNQYLWPLIITTEPSMSTIVMGIHYMAGAADQVPQWNLIMAVALIALAPPCALVIILQRWFEQGLQE
jgi:sn-glycerol 3-phosphate transport system permease protein